MKKGTMKFVILTAVLILSATLVLVGCMYAVGESPDSEKAYTKVSGAASQPTVPTPQNEMQKKFYDMYEFTNEDGAITVISKDYLANYWASNYDKQEIRTLTTEEVMFIIDDSVRIYNEYSKIILPEFQPSTEDAEIAARFPRVGGLTILPVAEDSQQAKDDCGVGRFADIQKIILYRLTALSSPDCFVEGWMKGFLMNQFIRVNCYMPDYTGSEQQSNLAKKIDLGIDENGYYDREGHPVEKNLEASDCFILYNEKYAEMMDSSSAAHVELDHPIMRYYSAEKKTIYKVFPLDEMSIYYNWIDVNALWFEDEIPYERGHYGWVGTPDGGWSLYDDY